jgi:hypothetical protein
MEQVQMDKDQEQDGEWEDVTHYMIKILKLLQTTINRLSQTIILSSMEEEWVIEEDLAEDSEEDSEEDLDRVLVEDLDLEEDGKTTDNFPK